MTMSRAHFQMIARCINEQRNAVNATAETKIEMDSLSRRFARELAATNPRFDGHRFLAACGTKV